MENENKCKSLGLIFWKITQSDKLMPNQGERNFAQLVILIKKPYWIRFVPSSNSTMADSVKYIPSITNALRTYVVYYNLPWPTYDNTFLKLSLVFCYQNCSDLLWEKFSRSLEQFIYVDSESLEQFLVTEWAFNLFLEVSLIW